MNEQAIRQRFPRASKAFIKANVGLQDSVSQQLIRNEPLAATPGKTQSSRRYVLRYTSYRTRLLDTDNLCPKFLTDALRYCGAIPDDTENDVILQISQKKVDHRNQEKTLVELI